ncbi:MAG: M10 family metallopeptidase C-terminal domain-containing protein [Cyanobacteriota bacterium]|jgi:Ca2+-binding RTX toxin-like protein
MVSKAYSLATNLPLGTTGTGLDQTVEQIGRDPGLAGANLGTNISGGMTAANGLNQLIQQAKQATGVASNGIFTISDVTAINAWIRANRLAEFTALHGDDNGTVETGFHLVQNNNASQRYRNRNLVDTVLDGIYHIGFPIQNGAFLNEDGNANAMVKDVADWLTQFYTDRATTNTGLDQITELVIADGGLANKIPWADVAGGADAANGLNALIKTGITTYNLAADGWISEADIVQINTWIRSNTARYNQFVALHGNDENNLETGFHLVQDDGANTTYFGQNLVDTVADGLYHIGFQIQNGQFRNEDGDANAMVKDVADWAAYFYIDQSTTGTGLDKIVDTIKLDTGLAKWTCAGNINSGASAADSLNHLIIDAIEATGVNSDGWITSYDVRLINQWVRDNHYPLFLELHGDDEDGTETGYHQVQNNGAITQYLGQNLVNTVADGLYHIGFEIEEDRLVNEDGDANAYLEDVASWLNYFYGQKVVILGAESKDTVTGTTGADHLLGYGGGDTLDGGAGNDLLDGDWGVDTLKGGMGDDFLDGGAENDKLDGGQGSDTYLVSGNEAEGWWSFQGFDTYTDTGTTGTDRIVALGAGNVDIGLLKFSATGIEVIDGTGAGGVVTLLGDWKANTLDFSKTTFIGGNIQINGGWGNDKITGTTGNDVIIGGGDNDALNGGNGSDDYLYFGFFDETWETFEAFDTIADKGTSGTDRILALSAGNVDVGMAKFSGSGVEIIDGTGAEGTVTLLGDWNANTLDFSKTTFIGGNIQINGYWGNDKITGTTGNDIIIGGGDDDTLNGGNGSDDYWVRGYVSEDWGTFEHYDTYGDTGATGTDRILALGSGNVDIGLKTFGPASGIEMINGTGAGGTVTLLGDWESNVLNFAATTFVGSNIQINGYWGNDTITGTTGNDIIIGGGDDDTLNGGNGSDDYWVRGYVSEDWGTFEHYDTYGDTGATGTDRILALGSDNVDIGLKTFGPASGIEMINGTGAGGAVTLLGNWESNILNFSATIFVGGNVRIDGDWGNDTITGTAGNDIIIGGGEDDFLNGGNGSDNYWVRGYVSDEWDAFDGYDTYSDTGASGVDRILALGSGNVDIGLLSFGPASGIEIIDATGTAGTVTLWGRWDDNLLDFSTTQLIGANLRIDGNWGDDTIIGSAGNDVILGGGGDDVLTGGLGADTLTGGDGCDSFVFNSTAEIGQGANRDWILDFETDRDLIDLAAIDANTLLAGNQAFNFIGAGNFSGQAGQLRFAGGLLSGDTNGDGSQEFELAVSGVSSLQSSHFVL